MLYYKQKVGIYMKFDVPPVVMQKLFDAGYEEQILDIVMESDEYTGKEVSDIPISPLLISNADEQVILSSKVYQAYQMLIERISNSTTAQEIPFFLLGNRYVRDEKMYIVMEEILYFIQDDLSEFKVFIDQGKFNELLNMNNYSILSIGHTHGNIEEHLKQATLARQIPDNIKNKYLIRDTGLNLSIADLWQHEAFKQMAKGQKEVWQTIIMYNGDMVMLADSGVQKINSIQTTLENGEQLYIATGNEIENSRKY